MVNIKQGNCKEVLRSTHEDHFDSVVTDPPYELGFMGKKWDDSGIAFDREMWEEVLRTLKPGGYCLAFSGTRTHHRMMQAMEEAGFRMFGILMWVYGSGFPKSLDVSKAIDKELGMEDEREVIGKKDAKIHFENLGDAGYKEEWEVTAPASDEAKKWEGWGTALKPAYEPIAIGRKKGDEIDSDLSEGSRFFYCPKAQRSERNIGCEDNEHPTVKPLELTSYLVRLVTPEKGKVLDPFVGSGSTAISAVLENRNGLGIELEEESYNLASQRVEYVKNNLVQIYDRVYDDPSNTITKKQTSSIEHSFWD